MYCNKCKLITENKEPTYISKGKDNRYRIKITCTRCNKLKIKPLKKNELATLPEDYKNINPSTEKQVVYEGGVIPAFIPLIIGAIAALGTAASGAAGVATAVTNSNKAKAELEEQKRHNEETERQQREAYANVTGRGLKQIKKSLKQGGSVSESEVKDIIKILGGLGFMFV